MIRAHIRFDGTHDVTEFVQHLNSDGTIDKYILQDKTGKFCADARSLMGVLYIMSDFNDNTYLVNETEDGIFPHFIDKYRVEE